MSIYATWLSIEDERQYAATMAARGINYGVIDEDGEVPLDELPEDMLDAPIIYQGSHILPSDDDPRGGSIDVAAIPDHITREGRDDAPEGALKDWLRLMVSNDIENVTLVLTRPQVTRLRDVLTEWLEAESRA